MTNREDFLIKLEGIRELAKASENVLSREQVDEYFADSELTEEQMKLVYDYLRSSAIAVTGGAEVKIADGLVSLRQRVKASHTAEESSSEESSEEEDASEEEKKSALEIYLEEISEDQSIPENIELMLFKKAADGDIESRNILARAYLSEVCDLAGEYESEGMNAEDLVSEANMGLMLALGELEQMDSLAAYKASLINSVGKYLEEATSQMKEDRDRDNAVAAKVNHLSSAIRSLEDDLGKQVSIEEVSAFLDIPLEEIKEVLDLAGDELRGQMS